MSKFGWSIICFLISINLFGATIKGKVRQSSSSELVAFANVVLDGTNLKTTTDELGNFTFNNVPIGRFSIIVQVPGFKLYTKEVRIGNSSESIDFGNIELESISTEKEEVTVVGVAGKESEASAMMREKNADNIVSVLSAKAIEKSPDITVANALQRISGVSLSRSQDGDGKYAILRGMNKRYNNTLINGLKVTSPDPKARFVPLDIIPSDLLQRLEVSKSITPDMEGDAIGGTVNVVMKDAPDSMLLNGYASAGISDLAFNQKFTTFNHSVVQSQDPGERNYPTYKPNSSDFTRENLKFNQVSFPPGFTAGVSFGTRLLPNKKLGFIASGSVQDLYRASTGTFYNTALSGSTNQSLYYTASDRAYSIHQNRIGFNGKLDYQFNKDNKLVFTSILLNSHDYTYRRSIDTSLQDQRTGPGTGYISYNERSRTQIQNIGNFSLQGYHDIKDKLFSIVWTGMYSKEMEEAPDQATVTTNFTAKAGGVKTTPYFDNAARLWQHNNDRDYTGKIDLYYRPKIANKQFEFKFGGLFRDKQRLNYQNKYTLSEQGINGGNLKPVWQGIDSVHWSFKSTDIYNTLDGNNYTVNEQITAGYGQVKTHFNRLEVLAGLRYEGTYEYFTTNLPATTSASKATITYEDLLPGLHLKYAITDKQNIRLSANKSISRPDYFELVPYHISGEFYDEYGNPYLLRTQATNYDLRYEYFPGKFNHLGAGLFYKDLLNPIEYVLDVSKASSPTVTPVNLGNATVKGFEFSGAVFVGNSKIKIKPDASGTTRSIESFHNSLIDIFQDFGLSGNYTYTESELTTKKIINDYVNNKTVNVDEKRPLQGTSKHIANLSLLYRNKQSGTNAQISYVFTGSRLERLSPFYGQDYYTKDYNTLDFSADQKINKHILIFTKMTNLLNNPYQIQIKNSLLVEKDLFGRFFYLGIRYKFN